MAPSKQIVAKCRLFAAPLTDMLTKKKPFKWSTEAKPSFENLKEQLRCAPLLHNPNFNRPFSIQCDAIRFGVGAVLSENNENGEEVPIAYMSRKHNHAQRAFLAV